MNEFELIDKFFAHHANSRSDVILGISDDAAVVRPPIDHDVVMTIDSLIENVHFLKKFQTPFDLGFKSLAISLSDIAAMGADPAWAILSLTLPKINEDWITEFCRGFFSVLDQYGMTLVGGNTTRGELAIHSQVTGLVPIGKAIRRDGAKSGDLIYVTGTLGDAALALSMLKKKIKIPKEFHEDILQKFFRPEPRIKEGITLRQFATSAIDISDGLAADLLHILEKSNVGATIKTSRLPLSKTLRTILKPEVAWQYALTGGEDYELCFTIPPHLQSSFELMFGSYDCGYICIGKIEQQKGLRILDTENQPYKIMKGGYEHFS